MATLTYMPTEHVPVLVAELIHFADPRPGETAIDCTFGSGGHARLVAERIGPEGTLICIDRDPSARERFAEVEPDLPCRSIFIGDRFDLALAELAESGERADLVYFDFGVSSTQIDARERGFSYSFDAPLDMRMDPEADLSAATVVNEWPQSRIAEILRDYGDERHARSIAREIVAARPIETTGELVGVIRGALPPKRRFGRGHPAKRSFQAVRIAVNDELAAIDAALPRAWSLLAPGGRLAGISFHSLEDRRVKRFLADRARGCECPPELPVCVCDRTPEAELLTRGGVEPSPGERAQNPRSTSAHLRVASKIDEGGEL
ncbi:MAG: 16S rRNA (cytosine(1402)-N(4))-methyltransferase RsmH [Solirubrobacterales bacterium]